VSDANLFALTPTYSGAQSFPQVFIGETPAAVCEGKVKPPTNDQERGWAQFELIGPSNFWAIFFGVGDFSDFAAILSAHQVAADTVNLSLRSWETDKKTRVAVRIGADRIDIPELHATFARCRPDQDASLGMRRW
jgi:hypothetical protein